MMQDVCDNALINRWKLSCYLQLPLKDRPLGATVHNFIRRRIGQAMSFYAMCPLFTGTVDSTLRKTIMHLETETKERASGCAEKAKDLEESLRPRPHQCNRKLKQRRRRRQRQRRQTIGLMSKTIVLQVHFKFWYISLPSSAKEQRTMSKIKVLWRT